MKIEDWRKREEKHRGGTPPLRGVAEKLRDEKSSEEVQLASGLLGLYKVHQGGHACLQTKGKQQDGEGGGEGSVTLGKPIERGANICQRTTTQREGAKKREIERRAQASLSIKRGRGNVTRGERSLRGSKDLRVSKTLRERKKRYR